MQRQLSSSAMPKLFPPEEEEEEDVEAKPEKAPAARTSAKERSVHLIPLLTVLCFLLLFLLSHDPLAFRYVELWWEPEDQVVLM